MKKKQTILVTGACGYLGNEVIELLLRKKCCSIIASDVDAKRAQKMSWFKSVRFMAYNLESRQPKLYKYFGNPDSVIHLSWAGLPNYKKLFHIEDNLVNNIYFLKSLAESGLKRITITGTCMEYGLVNGQLSEQMPTNPITSYSVAKDTLRKYVEFLAKEYGVDYRWLRIFYIFSTRQNGRGVISQLDDAIRAGKKEFNLSGGEQLRDFLPIEDVVCHIVNIALQDKQNGIFNCCSGKPVSIKTLVQEHVKNLGTSIKLNFGYYPYPDYEPMAYWGENDRLRQVFSKTKH